MAFINSDGVTLAVSPRGGLADEDIAKIVDVFVAETKFTPTQIWVIEAKNKTGTSSPSQMTMTVTNDATNLHGVW